MVAAYLVGRRDIRLRAALAWKTRVAQVKDVPEGASIGYGCTFITTHPTRIAVLPVGYYDGYDRAISNLGHVLIRGRRAPVRGRVCMNMVMVDVTDVPGAAIEDEAVLLGPQGEAEITAETLAGWAGTINYEVVARLAPHLPRVAVQRPETEGDSDRVYRAPRAN
jgi:alanine racemase